MVVTLSSKFLILMLCSILLIGCGGGNEEPATKDESNIFLDRDNDGVKDAEDRFPLNSKEWADFDGDEIGDNADNDDDNDSVADSEDAFPLDSAESIDTDGDGIGNNADVDDDNDGVEDRLDHYPLDRSKSTIAEGTTNSELDSDGDGVIDSVDAFPFDSSEYQDTDGDGVGNNRDSDDDNDGVEDVLDAFPLDASETVDNDRDGAGDVADNDDDNDGVYDESDDLPLDSSEHADTDRDGLANNVDTDDDNDGVDDVIDAFPLDASETEDSDADGIGDNADSDNDNDGVLNEDDEFPFDPDESLDTDNDGIGNSIDSDDDNDGVDDLIDEFPLVASEYRDTDADGTGDFADNDDDNDGVEDARDAFPLDPLEYIDSDNDGIGNTADTDDDGDGVLDADDHYPLNPDESQDTDRDAIGNNADDDDDGDGVADIKDRFPLDPNEYRDTDNDGIGNNADDDDDGDGVLDVDDAYPLDATRSEESLNTDAGNSGNSEKNDSSNENSDSDNETVVDDGADEVVNAPSEQPPVNSEPEDSDSDGVKDTDDAFPNDSSETMDTDNDGTADTVDAFPLNPDEAIDTDFDGIGNNADDDDDNDSLPDSFENDHGLNPLLDDSEGDLDNDGFTNLVEYKSGTDPNDSDSKPVSELPEVDLGGDITIYNTETLHLSSSVSGEGELTYQWQQVSGADVTFANESAASTEIIYTPSMETVTFTAKLVVSNERGSASDTVNVTLVDRIFEAAKVGNPKLLPADASQLEARIQQMIAQRQAQMAATQNLILGNGVIDYDPTRSSRLLEIINPNSTLPLLIGSAHGRVLATVAESEDGQRTAAFGHNVLVALDNGELTSFAQAMMNTIDWLLAAQTQSQDHTKTIALMLMGNGHMNKTESWLTAAYTNITVKRCTVESELLACLGDAHLIITGSEPNLSESSVIAALDVATNNHRSLLYTHNGSWNSSSMTNPVLQYFGVKTDDPGGAGNFYTQDLASWGSASAMRDESGTYTTISKLISRFQNNDFSFHISDCDDDDGNCRSVTAFNEEFLSPTLSIRSTVESFDEHALDIFSTQGQYDVEKLLILLADKYRETVVFPMSKASTATLPFLKSYFADMLVYTHRRYNPVQPDLGNFSRTDFSHITPVSQTVNTVSRENFRAAGVYALPGQTFTVTRTDGNANVSAAVFINTQRAGSTQHMNPNNGYNRPKVLQSHHVPIAAGQTIRLTSPYGGPVQFGFTDSGTAMTFSFDNVGLHPYWQPGMSDEDFLYALAADDYDWAEVVTEHFEIHSSVSKMLDTISEDSRWDSPSEIEYFVTKYHHNYSRVAAGFQGERIDVVSEIHDFADANGLDVAVWDKVQHFNADQQTCGYGCSGNPYDAAWAFSVLGHGDLHEVGHTMEDGRFKFNGFEGHATTNFYSYYAKSRGEDEDDVDASCQALKFSDYHNHLLAGDDMSSLGYTGWNYGATLMIELMMHAEAKGKLNNGWHLIPRLHLLSRKYSTSITNVDSWETARANLGFSDYSKTDAQFINNNDWLLVAVSYATELDYRPFFDLMGINYSGKANSQLDLMAFSPVESAFYLPDTDRDYCRTLVQSKVLY